MASAFDSRDEPVGPGLLVFDEMMPESVGEFLREVGDRGQE